MPFCCPLLVKQPQVPDMRLWALCPLRGACARGFQRCSAGMAVPQPSLCVDGGTRGTPPHRQQRPPLSRTPGHPLRSNDQPLPWVGVPNVWCRLQHVGCSRASRCRTMAAQSPGGRRWPPSLSPAAKHGPHCRAGRQPVSRSCTARGSSTCACTPWKGHRVGVVVEGRTGEPTTRGRCRWVCKVLSCPMRHLHAVHAPRLTAPPEKVAACVCMLCCQPPWQPGRRAAGRRATGRQRGGRVGGFDQGANVSSYLGTGFDLGHVCWSQRVVGHQALQCHAPVA